MVQIILLFYILYLYFSWLHWYTFYFHPPHSSCFNKEVSLCLAHLASRCLICISENCCINCSYFIEGLVLAPLLRWACGPKALCKLETAVKRLYSVLYAVVCGSNINKPYNDFINASCCKLLRSNSCNLKCTNIGLSNNCTWKKKKKSKFQNK